ncbi:MAG: F0F1 ATP synthase subunit gamma [Bacillota bacterium]
MRTLAIIESQIQTAETLSSIVGTMRTLAMVNIRRFEHATGNLREYARTIRLALHVATAQLPPGQWERTRLSPEGPGLAVLVGSDQGLCGQFNDRMLDHARPAWSSPGWCPVVVGTRLAGMLETAGASPLAVLDAPVSVEAITSQARRLLQIVEEQREQGHCGRLRVMFHRHLGSVRYRETTLDLLPFSPRQFRHLPTGEPPFRTLPQYGSEPSQLLADLLPQYFLSELALALAESAASESAARLTAMEGASRTIEQHLEELMNQYRQQRQEEITAELADVLAGVEAVQPQGE